MDSTEERPPTRMPDLAASVIRTWVPIGVGAALTFAASRLRLVINPADSMTVGMFAVTAVSAGYYGLARLLEAGRRPWLRAVGRFMLGGVVRVPRYVTEAEDRMLERVGRHRADA